MNATLPIISFGRFVDSKPENITDTMLIYNLNKGVKFLQKNYKELIGILKLYGINTDWIQP